MSNGFSAPPSLDDLARIADDAFALIPEELRRHVGNVLFTVEDFPDDDVIRDMDLDSPFDLLGLYHGVPLDQQSVLDPPRGPERIFLYRRPILDYWCETGEDLTHLVRHVLIHEIGHHFGLSDEDMDRIEQQD